MSTLRDGILSAARDAYCTQVRSSPQWFGNLRRVLTPTDLRQRADFLIQWVCGEPPNSEDWPDPPFSGGQCPVRYQVNVEGPGPRGFANGACLGGDWTKTNENIFWGPILGIRLRSQFVCAGSGGVAYEGAELLCHGHAPVPASPRSPTPIWVSGALGGAWYSVRITSVSRIDGQPDNCGDPFPDLPDPAPISQPTTITYGDNNQYSLTVPIIFAPVYIALDGSLKIPIQVDISPTFNVKGELELFPNFDLDLNFNAPNPDDGPEGEPPPDEPTGDGNDDKPQPSPDPEKPPEDRIYAAVVRCRIEPEARPSGVYQEVGPDIYVPRLGSVRFGSLLSGVMFWTEDLDVKGLTSVINCPIPWGADVVTFNAADGVVGNYAPIYTRPNEWPPYISLGNSTESDGT